MSGMLLIKKGISKIDFKIDKCEYKPGDIIRLECFIDNRECDKSIEAIKIKILKSINCLDSVKGRRIRRYNILYKQVHNSGVRKGVYEERTYELPLKNKLIMNNQIIPLD